MLVAEGQRSGGVRLGAAASRTRTTAQLVRITAGERLGLPVHGVARRSVAHPALWIRRNDGRRGAHRRRATRMPVKSPTPTAVTLTGCAADSLGGRPPCGAARANEGGAWG